MGIFATGDDCLMEVCSLGRFSLRGISLSSVTMEKRDRIAIYTALVINEHKPGIDNGDSTAESPFLIYTLFSLFLCRQ